MPLLDALILMEARTEPDGYKKIIERGDEYNNSTKKDMIKLNDLKSFSKKNMEGLL
jgi:hypothetical protein